MNMKLRQLTGFLIAASAIVTSTLPAHAGPFDSTGGIFTPATQIPAATVGNVTATSAPKTSNGAVGNSEIQGLGDHQSWVDPKILAKDPRALCSDVGLGNNTSTKSSDIALATSSSTRSSSSQSHNDGGGGGGSFLGIVSVSGNGSTQGSKNNSNQSDRSTNSTDKNSSSSSTVVRGRNCDAFVNSAASRDMNYQDNLTKRYEVKTRERGSRVQTLLENK
jgi:hypothetical protein